MTLASYDFDSITAAQALTFNQSMGDTLSVARANANLVPTFDNTAWTVTLTDNATGRSVLFGPGFHNELQTGPTRVWVGGSELMIGAPRGEFSLRGDWIYAGGGNDTILGGEDAWGGQGRDVFESSQGSHLERIWDFESGDMISVSQIAPAASEYVEATMSDESAAHTFARDQIRAGKTYVVVAVGGDLIVVGDVHGWNDGLAVTWTKIMGRGLADISHTDFLAMGSAAPFPATPPLTRPDPPKPDTTTPTYDASGTIIGNMDAGRLGSLLGADILSANAGDLQISSPTASMQLSGTGFTFDANSQLTGGTTSRIGYQSAEVKLQLTVKADAQPFGGWVAANATQQAFSTLLQGNDTIGGAAGGDVLRTYGGDDLLYGLGGGDSLYGGDGNDTVYATRPANISAGYGAGTSFLRGEAGNDTLVGGDYFDDMHGNMGADSLRGGNANDWVVGGQGNDVLHGEIGDDIVYGNLGADLLYGGYGDDFVRGGQDNDVLHGESGEDWMTGDRGADTLTGGGGADTFHIFVGAGLEQVTDFSYAAGDRVNLLTAASYTVGQVGGDTVIDLGGGDRMVLVGVAQTSLGAGWITTG